VLVHILSLILLSSTMAELGMRVISAAAVRLALQGIGYPALTQAMELALKEFSSKQVDQVRCFK
jgi:hypothetical protein